MKKISASVLSVATLAVLSTACVKVESLDPIKAITKPFQKESKKNKTTQIKSGRNTSEQIQVGEHKLQVVSTDVLKKMIAEGKAFAPNSKQGRKMLSEVSGKADTEFGENNPFPTEILEQEDDLQIGFPISLIDEQYIFGGVITKVSDKQNENLGSLKLTDLSPLHVKPVLQRGALKRFVRDASGKIIPGADGKPQVEEISFPALSLTGCFEKCTERSLQEALLHIPITGLDEERGLVYLNVSFMGRQINLFGNEMDDKTFSAVKTSSVDYDYSTLVYDVQQTFTSDKDPSQKLDFTVRWYLKLASVFNSAFLSQKPTKGVGYFTTTRTAEGLEKITRFSLTQQGSADLREEKRRIHYYIKNVPTEYRAYFSGAIENWNKKFNELLNVEPLSYEFVEKEDPRHAQLVPGDIRYNIIEWDLDNKASYGGLGPSIANQFTGQTISANVLIQGPTIVEMYTKWFELSKDVRALRAQGQVAEADKIVRDFSQRARLTLEKRQLKDVSIKLGNKLDFRINANRPELEDPMIKNHFEVVPAGLTYQEYMKGYFTEMLEHELGHNLGLRHNFKGNLGATDSGERGSAARSIMEYLGRPYRMLNEIGSYDEMAILYGYDGKEPEQRNWFCTDEHEATAYPQQLGGIKVGIAKSSPECTKNDATKDPFSFWEARMTRALDLILDMNSASAPVWKTEEVKTQINEISIAFANYAAAAESTGDTWTNFFGKPGRPQTKTEVRPYVLTKLKALICDPKLADIIKGKESQEASELAQKNLNELRAAVVAKNKEMAVFTPSELNCN